MTKKYNQHSDPRKDAYFNTVDAKLVGNKLTLTGAVTGEGEFDGSGELTIHTEPVVVPYPDFYAPFSDDLEVVRGYGLDETKDVSAAQDGSLEITTGRKLVHFARNSTEVSFNSAGEMVVLGEDEPSISAKGLNLHDARTNYYLYSENFNNSYWSRENSTVEDSDVYIPLEDGSVGLPLQKITVGSSGFRSIRRISSPKEAGTRYTWSVFAKKGTLSEFFINIVTTNKMTIKFNLETGVCTYGTGSVVPDGFGMEYIRNGIYRCWGSFIPETSGDQDKLLDFSSGSEGYLYAGGAMMSTSDAKLPPYVPTTDNVSVGASPFSRIKGTNLGNLEEGVTISLVTNIPKTNNQQRFFLHSSDISLWQQGGTQVYYKILGAYGAYSSTYFTKNKEITVTFSLIIDRENNLCTLKVYYDDTLLTPITVTYDSLGDCDYGDIELGRWNAGGFRMDSYMRELKIWHKPLTDEQVFMNYKKVTSQS